MTSSLPPTTPTLLWSPTDPCRHGGLELLRPMDLFGIPPLGWPAEEICRIIGAHTFHYGVFVEPGKHGWITSESLGKGTSISRFVYPKAYVYRIRGLGAVKPHDIYSVHAEYGDLPYNWEVNYRTAVWWLAREYLHRRLPVSNAPPYNCVGWVCCLSYEFGFKLIPDDEYATPFNLEHSPMLEYIGMIEQ